MFFAGSSVAAKNSDGNKKSGEEMTSVVCMEDTNSKAASFNEAIMVSLFLNQTDISEV